MKKLIAYSLLLIAFFLSSCSMRVTPRDVDRVDQELKGNRGIIGGSTLSLPEPDRKKTRRMYDVEIELPSLQDADVSAPKKVEKVHIQKQKITLDEDRKIQGNMGYIKKGKAFEEKEEKRDATKLKSAGALQTPQVIYTESIKPVETHVEKKTDTVTAEEKKPRKYVVLKGDTLQEISKKMYGTTRKWKKIYEANKHVLKSPDMIRPGQELVIPLD